MGVAACRSRLKTAPHRKCALIIFLFWGGGVGPRSAREVTLRADRRETNISRVWSSINCSFRIYWSKLPRQRWMSCSIIWLVSLIVKLREISWTIRAWAPRIFAACATLCPRIDIYMLALDGSWFANWHRMKSLIGACSSVCTGVSRCSFCWSCVVTG